MATKLVARRNTTKGSADEDCENGVMSAASRDSGGLTLFGRKQQDSGPGTPLHKVNSITLYMLINYAFYCLFFWIKQPAFLQPLLQSDDPERVVSHLFYGSYTLSIFAFAALCSVLIYRALFVLFDVIVNSTPSLAGKKIWSVLWSIQLGFLCVWHAMLSLFIGVEATVYADMAVHTYEFDWIRIVTDANQQKDLGLSKKDHAWRVVSGIIVVVLVQLGVYIGSKKIAAKWRHCADKAIVVCGVLLLVGGLAFVAFDHQVDTHRYELRTALFMSHLWDPEDADIHLHPKVPTDEDQAGYATNTKDVTLLPPDERKNYVFIIGESWRYDVLNDKLMPNTMKIVRDPACFRSENHFTAGHVTELGTFGLMYGIPSIAYHHYSLGKIPSYPMKLLEENGYMVQMIIASVPWGYPNNFVFTQYDNVKIQREDQALLEDAQKFLQEREADGKNFVLYLFLEDPHYPYSPSNSSFLIEKPYLVKGQFEVMMNTEERMQLYWNSYHNTILSFDDSIRRLRLMLDKFWKNNKLAVVFSADHGQEMFEHGGFGHAGSTFWNEKTKVALMVCIPGEEKRIAKAQAILNQEDMITNHIDVWPTLFDGTNVTIRHKQTWTTGLSMFDPSTYAKRIKEGIVISGRHFPQMLRPCAVFTKNCRFWFVYLDRSYTAKKIVRITDGDDNTGCPEEKSASAVLSTFDKHLRSVMVVELDEVNQD
eukprot:TRINITY_DN6078_c0_g1_i1.p1 TRINITY_DN6078_c0_g1~~TRINITY_DN6078_c0_g1_i1.p1  ORF type:complete len:707 (-),score=160.39 TRINITY_DN6078_c0_g1_i1:1631-3751(-)